MAFMPSAEREDTPETIHLKLEIPGLEAKDLDIQVTDRFPSRDPHILNLRLTT
jgi:HSP20 family molecular chaperone IbpA